MAASQACVEFTIGELRHVPAASRASHAAKERLRVGTSLGWSAPQEIREGLTTRSPSADRRGAMKSGQAGAATGARAAATSSAEPKAIELRSGGQAAPGWLQITHLEGNSWLWNLGGVHVAVDLVLGNLDFGIPWLYDAAKKFVKDYSIDDLPELDCLLLTQSLDDHCHMNTLRPLAHKLPNLRVIATPNAQPKLGGLFHNVTYLAPGDSCTLEGRNGVKLDVRATKGPVLGPPWQRPENGYIVRPMDGEPGLSVYYEPHCKPEEELEKLAPVDCVVTPVIKQMLPAFTLVAGQEDAVEVCQKLQASYVVPFNNGDMETRGLLGLVVSTLGTIPDFQALLSKDQPDVKVVVIRAGEASPVP